MFCESFESHITVQNITVFFIDTVKTSDLSLSNCLRVGMGGAVTVMKLNKRFSVEMFNITVEE